MCLLFSILASGKVLYLRTVRIAFVFDAVRSSFNVHSFYANIMEDLNELPKFLIQNGYPLGTINHNFIHQRCSKQEQRRT